MDLQIGDLIFVKGTSLLDKLIEWITKSKYSHVAVYVGDGKVIEAQGDRTVGYQSLSYYAGKYDVYRYTLALTPVQRAIIVWYLRKQIGCEYDYLDILVLLIRYLFRLNIPWHETRRHICSMLARDAYKTASLSVPEGNVSPEDLVEWPKFYRAA